MPTFKIQGPNGVVTVNAPDGATALRMAQQQDAKPAPSPAYQKAMAREKAMDRFRPAGGPESHVADPFMPYVGYGAGYLGQGAENLYRRATGQPIEIPAATAARAVADNTRQRDQQWAAQHPGQATAANVLSMFVTPVKSGAAATSLLGKFAQGAKAVGQGAGLGALYGAAEAPDGQHLNGALTGAASGAATTGLLMGAGKAVKAVGSPVIQAASNRFGPELPGAAVPKVPARQAASYVARKAAQSGANLSASSAPTAAEAMGNTGRVSLAALGRQSGQTPEAAQAMFSERRAGRPDRILDTVAKATGVNPAGAKGNVDAIIEQGRATSAPLFKAAFENNPGPIWNDELAALAQRPAVRKAIALTGEQLQNAGKDPFAMGIKLDPATGGRVQGDQLGDVLQSQPTAEAWDLIRKNVNLLPERDLSGRVIRNGEAGVRNTGLDAVSGDLTTALKNAIPGYDQALSAAGDYKSAEGAFNAARGKLFSQKFTPADFSDLLDGASPGEQNAIKHAVASDLYDAAQNGRLTLNATKSPAFRAKLTLAYGAEPAGQIGDTLANEANMASAENQILPQAGSQTAPLSDAIKEQQQNPLGEFATDAITGAIRHGPTGVVEAGIKTGLKSLGSSLKTPGMGTNARDEAGRLLMMSPQELADYLSAGDMTKPAPSAMTPTPVIGGRLGGALTGAIMPRQDQTIPQ